MEINDKTTYVADDSGEELEQVPFDVITPVNKVERHTREDLTSKINNMNERMADLEARRSNYQAMLDKINVEIDKLPARVERE